MGLTSRHFVTVTSVFISWIKYCIVLLIALVFFFSTCVVSSRLLPQFFFYFYWVLFLREKEKREVNREGRTYTQATLYFLVIFSYFIVWLNTGIPVASFNNYHISLFKSTCKRQNRAASGVYMMQARRRNWRKFFNQHWNTSDTYNYSLCQMDHRFTWYWPLIQVGRAMTSN